MPRFSFLRHSAFLGVLFFGSIAARQAHAETFVVTSTADNDGSSCGADCSLRQAINAANSDPTSSDVITFDEKVFAAKQTIELVPHSNTSRTTACLPTIYWDTSIIGPTTPGSGVTIHIASRETVLPIMCPFDCTIAVTISNISITGADTAIYNDGAYLKLENCTLFDNNFGINSRDGYYSWGVPVEFHQVIPATLIANNCTFFNNRRSGIFSSCSETIVNSCTVIGSEKGIYCYPPKTNIYNSISVGNTIYNIPSSLAAFKEVSHNITQGTPEEAGLDPRGLQDNGGPTRTIALVKGGAAVDTGSTDLLTDQRGKSRPQDGRIDVGAFEYAPKPPTPNSPK